MYSGGRTYLQSSILAQVGFAFGRIESALTVLVSNLSELSSLAAKTERIDALFSGMCPSPSTCAMAHLSQHRIAIRNASRLV